MNIIDIKDTTEYFGNIKIKYYLVSIFINDNDFSKIYDHFKYNEFRIRDKNIYMIRVNEDEMKELLNKNELITNRFTDVQEKYIQLLEKKSIININQLILFEYEYTKILESSVHEYIGIFVALSKRYKNDNFMLFLIDNNINIYLKYEELKKYCEKMYLCRNRNQEVALNPKIFDLITQKKTLSPIEKRKIVEEITNE